MHTERLLSCGLVVVTIAIREEHPADFLRIPSVFFADAGDASGRNRRVGGRVKGERRKAFGLCFGGGNGAASGLAVEIAGRRWPR